MFLNINNSLTLLNEPLSKHCSFKIGGNAKYFVNTHNIDALLDVLNLCKSHSIPYKIIGNGSNMLFDDLGYNGAIIKYTDNSLFIKTKKLYVSSGVYVAELIKFCTHNNLGGTEFAVGVPAQLGGAIVNNLGAYNQEISTYIEHVTVLRKNHIVYLSKEDCNFSYHSSNLQNSHDIILAAIFNLPSQPKSSILQNAKTYFIKRKQSQPLEYHNAGSIFKRDNNITPAKLIDDAGLKGLRVGDAQVSTKHAGFIVNLGNATCKNVLKLIEIIKNKIFEKYGVNISLEIEYLSYL